MADGAATAFDPVPRVDTVQLRDSSAYHCRLLSENSCLVCSSELLIMTSTLIRKILANVVLEQNRA
jgi:hypothetical protein